MRLKDYSRYELKYIISLKQRDQLVKMLADYMTLDAYGDVEGRYPITSLYYDSPDYQAYWDKIEGHRFRRKVRLRVYGNPAVMSATPCFVEIKQRINKTLQKKRVVLPYETAAALCSGEPVDSPLSAGDQTVVDEVLYLQNTLQLQPSCVVRYDRLAFDGSLYEPDLRVTFDTNLKGRVHDLDLRSEGCATNYYFLSPEFCVLEIKVNYRVPYWLTALVGQHQCTLRRMSKYCTALEQTKILRQQQITS